MQNTHYITFGLRQAARQARETWVATDYPHRIRPRERQFAHAAMHIGKAIGKIFALIDLQEHDKMGTKEAKLLRTELPKLLADLLHCALKLADTAPDEPIDFAAAYIRRATQLAKRWNL